jgi:hypothetical protein
MHSRLTAMHNYRNVRAISLARARAISGERGAQRTLLLRASRLFIRHSARSAVNNATRVFIRLSLPSLPRPREKEPEGIIGCRAGQPRDEICRADEPSYETCRGMRIAYPLCVVRASRRLDFARLRDFVGREFEVNRETEVSALARLASPLNGTRQ